MVMLQPSGRTVDVVRVPSSISFVTEWCAIDGWLQMMKNGLQDIL